MIRHLYAVYISALLLTVTACAKRHVPSTSLSTTRQMDVQLEPDEADAALAILHKRLSGEMPAAEDWRRLFSSTGYQHLQEREAGMGRAFTDSMFTAFLMSDTLLARALPLEQTLAGLKRLDISAAAGNALKYLPARTPLRARLYLEIKPKTNSFVFTGRDSTPSIFLYVDPSRSSAQLANTVAHELHHIGLGAACPDRPFARAIPAQGMLLRFLGAFGEGQAMLAAAGSPDIHPHATDDDSVRTRWDRDVSRAGSDVAELSRFFESVLDGRLTSADSVQQHAFTYYGVQGPWYTVGWLMASTIERQLGHAVLVGSLCEPTRFMALYNEAARQSNMRGVPIPTWNAGLVSRLEALRTGAD